MDLATLPARLRAKRGDRTLYAISVETGVSVPTLSRIEHGAQPQGTTLATLEAWLDGYELGEPNVPALHVAIDHIAGDLRRQLHVAVQGWEDVHRQNTQLQALVNRQREEIERLRGNQAHACSTLTTIRAAGWLWEAGHYQAAHGTFYARVWTPSIDPLHSDSPAAEHWGYGETPEEATERAWEERNNA